MSMIVNLCDLVNSSFALMNPTEIHDTKRRELLDYFLGGSMDSEGKTAIKFFESTDRFEKGYFKIRKQFPNCNPAVGSGSICGKDAVPAAPFQKYEKDIELSQFTRRVSPVVEIQSEGTLFDYCVAIGQNELLQDFVNQLLHGAWSIRTTLNKDLANVLANNVSNYPDGTPFNPAAPKALQFYAYDNDTTPPLAVVNPAALAIVEAQLDMLNEQKQWKAIGGTLLKGVSNVIQMSPTFGSMTFPTVLRDGVFDVDIPANPTLNRPLMYLAQRDAIDVLTYNWSMNRSGTIPLKDSEVLSFLEKAMANSQTTGDVVFPVMIGNLTYDCQMNWEKCGRNLTLRATLEIFTYFHVPTITSCSGVGILAYDVCPIAEAVPCTPTEAPSFDYLCLDFEPVGNCADYITGDYTLTLPDNSIITGTVSGNANVTTENGIFALLQSIFAKNTIAGIVRNKCNDYMLTAMVNGYTFASGDVITLNFPCLAQPIKITVNNCADCTCTPSSARISNIIPNYNQSAATFDFTPALSLVNDSVVSYSWNLVTGNATLVNGSTQTANLVSVGDGDIILTLVIVTNNATIQARIFNNIKSGAIEDYQYCYITSDANSVTWNTDANITDEFEWSVDSSVNGIITNGTAAVSAMSGSFAYVKATPSDVLSFRIKDSTIWAQAAYNCASQGGVLLRKSEEKPRNVVTEPITAPKTKAKTKA